MGTTRLELVQQKLKELNRTSNASSAQFKPKPGTHVVRIVPNQEAPEWPFVEMYMYYNIGGHRSLVSPSSYGEYDPIKSFTTELYKTGEKEDYFKAKQLEPKLRTYLPVIERGKEHEGVKWWGFGKTILKDLLNLMSDEDYGDITDPVNGTDLTLIVEGPNEAAGKKYPTTSINPKRNVSPITEDANLLKRILEEQTSIKDVFPQSPESDLMEVLTAIQNESAYNANNNQSNSNYNQGAKSAPPKKDRQISEDPEVNEKLANFGDLVKNKKNQS